MDRELILALANLLGSKVDNSHSKNIRLQCPLAPKTHARGSDAHPAWSVLDDPTGPSPTKCWACDEAGTVVEVLERGVEWGIPGLEAALEFARENDKSGLSGAFGRLRLQRQRQLVDDSAQPGRRDQEWLERYVRQSARWTHPYLIERGIVASDIRKWFIGYDEGPTKIGYSHIHHRLVFPVWDHRRALVGATMRSVLPEGVDPPKYRDWPGLPKGDVFYGEHLVDSTIRLAYLVEGILDVVVASRYLPNVLGLLGANTGIGPVRLEKLLRWADRVYLLLDPDTAGSEAVDGKTVTKTGRDGVARTYKKPGLRDLLRQHMVTQVVRLPPKKDPAVLREAIVPLIRDARYLL